MPGPRARATVTLLATAPCPLAARYGVYEPTFADEEPVIDLRQTTLATIAPAIGAAFTHVYDFGDYWRHDAVVRAGRLDPRRPSPLCIAGERAGLPEDCGDIRAYGELLELLEEGRGEAYDEMLRWLGGDYDPDGFDRNLVNQRLHELGAHR